jgi:hypothetical protein
MPRESLAIFTGESTRGARILVKHSQRQRGGMFSVALSVESPTLSQRNAKAWTTLPDVIRHTALRSSDFPPLAPEGTKSGRPVRLPT